jgi:hypothetical protein
MKWGWVSRDWWLSCGRGEYLSFKKLSSRTMPGSNFSSRSGTLFSSVQFFFSIPFRCLISVLFRELLVQFSCHSRFLNTCTPTNSIHSPIFLLANVRFCSLSLSSLHDPISLLARFCSRVTYFVLSLSSTTCQIFLLAKHARARRKIELVAPTKCTWFRHLRGRYCD